MEGDSAGRRVIGEPGHPRDGWSLAAPRHRFLPDFLPLVTSSRRPRAAGSPAGHRRLLSVTKLHQLVHVCIIVMTYYTFVCLTKVGYSMR